MKESARLDVDVSLALPRQFSMLSPEEQTEVAAIVAAVCDVPVDRRMDACAWAMSVLVESRLFDREVIDAIVNGPR